MCDMLDRGLHLAVPKCPEPEMECAYLHDGACSNQLSDCMFMAPDWEETDGYLGLAELFAELREDNDHTVKED